MDWFVTFFQNNPLIPLFLTLGLGFWLGKVKIKSFTLGSVAATLIVGVVIGQMKIKIPDLTKTVFFLFFLFSIGYSAGPQFFRAFKDSKGIRMAGFAVVEALVCAGLVIAAAHIMGYSNGVAAGLYAGSQTVSACLGMLADTVREMPSDPSVREHILMIIPACYAVTYVFGTIGTAWFLSNVGPAMLGGLKKVNDEVASIEQEMDSSATSLAPGLIRARRPVSFRAYEADIDFFNTPRTIGEIQEMYAKSGVRVLVERARVDGKIVEPSSVIKINKGDTIVLGGRAANIVRLSIPPGPEISDPELLNFGAERTPTTIASAAIDGMTLEQLLNQDYMERVMVASISRNGMNIPLKNQTILHAGDVLTLIGWPVDVDTAAGHIGYADRATDTTDMVFVGLGIAAGCIIGALSWKINGISFGLGTSVGALIAGLSLGWLRSRKPSFGHIPSSVVWLFNNLGINMFIAILGMTAGAALLTGLKEAGATILLAGAVLTLLGLVINIFIARRIFRFNRPEVLGCVAGGRCAVAAIGAIQDTLQSDVPNLGYTITYAVANVSLVFASLLVLFLC